MSPTIGQLQLITKCTEKIQMIIYVMCDTHDYLYLY